MDSTVTSKTVPDTISVNYLVTISQLKWTDGQCSSLLYVVTTTMHDGICCLGSVHQIYTKFCAALWDTLSGLYSGITSLTKHSETTIKRSAPYMVHHVGCRGGSFGHSHGQLFKTAIIPGRSFHFTVPNKCICAGCAMEMF